MYYAAGIRHLVRQLAGDIAQKKRLVWSSGTSRFFQCVGQVTFHTHLPDGQGYGQAARGS